MGSLRKDTRVYICQACKSFISSVDCTVGRGTMGQQSLSFIIEPTPTVPFNCGIGDGRETCLSSGAYILQDLSCPNSQCDASLGWKYQDCVPILGFIPPQNSLKIGQFWMYAEALMVVNPCRVFPTCSG